MTNNQNYLFMIIVKRMYEISTYLKLQRKE